MCVEVSRASARQAWKGIKLRLRNDLRLRSSASHWADAEQSSSSWPLSSHLELQLPHNSPSLFQRAEEDQGGVAAGLDLGMKNHAARSSDQQP